MMAQSVRRMRKVKNSKFKGMKKLFKTPLQGGITLVLGLILISSTQTFAKSSSNEKDVDTALDTKSVKELNDAIIEDIVVIEEAPKLIMIFDENQELIYDADGMDLLFDPLLEILIRRSDFLIQIDGVRYYRLSE